MSQLGYLGIEVSSVDKWGCFAEEVLGLQASNSDFDDTLFLKMDEYHHRFALTPGQSDDLRWLGWEVADEQALTRLGAQLQARGVAVSPGSRELAEMRKVRGLIQFADPSGIQSEAYYGPLVEFDKPFHSPRAISGFETGGQGCGHLVILVDDFEESLAFYRDGLGLRISDYIDLPTRSGAELNAVFLHCNPRHHSIAFIAMPGAPKRLAHFMLQLSKLDDVGSTYYLCKQQNVPLATSLGRHSNDHMVSFYLQTPSGFQVEYGWGARTVDDSTWTVVHHKIGSVWGHLPETRPQTPVPIEAVVQA